MTVGQSCFIKSHLCTISYGRTRNGRCLPFQDMQKDNRIGWPLNTGSTAPVSLTVTLIQGSGGDVTLIQGSGGDVTLIQGSGGR